MENHNIAIVGLGRVGKAFLEKAMSNESVMTVKAVCEMCDTPGRKLAEEKDIPVVDLGGIIEMGIDIDVIFDLSGDENVSRILQEKLVEARNSYTQVAPARLARLVWSLIADGEYLPNLGKTKSQIYAEMLLEG
ncbi:hypothetical protein FMR86_02010 [Desulfovibrio sp. JC010]|nr:hypothetical protein [Desulfovibrio sp. JC010]NDV25417.1 hypothetical protein [Desulfovibrio sp. JC010]